MSRKYQLQVKGVSVKHIMNAGIQTWSYELGDDIFCLLFQCREIGAESHDDIMQVLTSLQSVRCFIVCLGEDKTL